MSWIYVLDFVCGCMILGSLCLVIITLMSYVVLEKYALIATKTVES